MSKKIKFIITLVVLNILIILTALILLEIRYEGSSLRQQALAGRQISPCYWWSLYSSNSVRVGGTFGPLKLVLHPFMVYKNMPGQKENEFSINSSGFRGKEINKGAKARKRIILIGGSSAFGQGLKNDEETCACQLEKILNVEVINAGVIGYCSGQELTYLFTELVDLKPDLVIALNGWNDYSQIGCPKKHQFIGCNGQNQIEPKLELLSQLTNASFAKRIIRINYVLFPRVISRIRTFIPDRIKNRDPVVDMESAAGVYANNMIKVKKAGNSFNFKFICLLQPQKMTPDNKRQAAAYQTFRNRVKTYFDLEEVKYIDLNGDDFINIFTAGRFVDDMHLDGAATRNLAEIIAKAITDEGLL